MSRHRDYCFTIFDDDCPKKSEELRLICFKNKAVVYAICGIELCPKTQRSHLQCYIAFKNAKTIKATQKFTKGGKMHCEVRKGEAWEARNYCWKGPMKHKTAEPHAKAVWWETGILPVGKGKRTDILKTKESLENGANIRDIIRETTSNQSIQYAQKWLTYFEKKRNWKPEVFWFWGKTGLGKTREAHRIFNDESKKYCVNETNRWWDGYDSHENVIFDDIRADFCKYHTLLRLLDRYEMRVEVKGAFRQLLAKRIIITSPFKPEALYGCREECSELLRRIDRVREFT